MMSPKNAPKIGRERRVTKGTKSGNPDLDSYAGKQTAGDIKSPNTSVSGKKGTPPPAAKTGGNPLSGNLVPKQTGTQVKGSFPRGKKTENRTTY